MPFFCRSVRWCFRLVPSFLVLAEFTPVFCDGAIPAYSEPATSSANSLRGLSCGAGALERPKKKKKGGGGEVERDGKDREGGDNGSRKEWKRRCCVFE